MNSIQKFWKLLKAIWRLLVSLFAIRTKECKEPKEPEEPEEPNRKSSSDKRTEESPISNVSRNSISDNFTESEDSIKEILEEFFKSGSKADDEEEPVGTYYTYNIGNYKVIREDYYSINSLVRTLRNRDNNTVMQYLDSSNSTDLSFSGTSSYDRAENLLLKGWDKLLYKIKPTYDKKVEILSHKYIRKKSSNINTVVGGTPNVPRALMCLPNSLINREPSVKKLNTIEIIYDVSIACNIDITDAVKSGIALLSAIKLLEKSGIQLKLTCCFFSTASRHKCDAGEVVIGTILLKNYTDRLNLLKICFPLAHPSMVRRIGFKFLETIPGITDERFSCGYGSTVPIEELRKIFQSKNTVILNYYTIAKEMNFDTEKLIKYIEDNVKKQN